MAWPVATSGTYASNALLAEFQARADNMTPLMEEILQQPEALSCVRKYYASPGAIPMSIRKKLGISRETLVVFTGMGSSLHAAYPAQAWLTAMGYRAIVWEAAELLHHHLNVLSPDTLLVVVSQSGETVEITRLIEVLPKKINVVAVTNVENSHLARKGKLLLPMMAGVQAAVSTKTYTCAVAVLMYLAFAIAGEANRPLSQALMHAVDAQEDILERRDDVMLPTLEFFNHPPYVALLSRGADMASAFQGSLMLKEVARLAAEPITAAQFRHGPIEIVNPSHCYIIFARHTLPGAAAPRTRKPATLLLKLADDIRSHKGRVLLISDRTVDDVTNMRLIHVDPIRLGLGTLVDIVLIQLLAHDYALRAGFEPGKFWIAEGVTRRE
ncbi:MAG: SIS domain-containing protein [Acidobacteria bacterium]|nr:MAG: SIS domain-containing protein [Acidobacteriota bacterium]